MKDQIFKLIKELKDEHKLNKKDIRAYSDAEDYEEASNIDSVNRSLADIIVKLENILDETA